MRIALDIEIREVDLFKRNGAVKYEDNIQKQLKVAILQVKSRHLAGLVAERRFSSQRREFSVSLIYPISRISRRSEGRRVIFWSHEAGLC